LVGFRAGSFCPWFLPAGTQWDVPFSQSRVEVLHGVHQPLDGSVDGFEEMSSPDVVLVLLLCFKLQRKERNEEKQANEFHFFIRG